jgi:chromosome segregation and condensation protein ScpB
MLNLRKANEVRASRARWKESLAEDRSRVVEAFLAPKPWILSARVSEVLLAVPKFGPVKVDRVMQVAGVGSGARVRDLTKRQRCVLIRELRARI